MGHTAWLYCLLAIFACGYPLRELANITIKSDRARTSAWSLMALKR